MDKLERVISSEKVLLVGIGFHKIVKSHDVPGYILEVLINWKNYRIEFFRTEEIIYSIELGENLEVYGTKDVLITIMREKDKF